MQSATRTAIRVGIPTLEHLSFSYRLFMEKTSPCAELIEKTDTSDAVAFYKAFAMTSVRMNATDELDVNDPHTLTLIRDRGMTLLDIMQHSAAGDMVAREWVTGFRLSRRGADILRETCLGRQAIVRTFLTLLATEPDTFIIKKHVPEWHRKS